MFSFERSASAFGLEEFLLSLKKMLIQHSNAIVSASQPMPPCWASSCPHLLYSDKSTPPIPALSEPGKLYISYKTDDPSAVMLVGISKDKQPIKRKLKIKTKSASSLITITSEHVDFITGKCFTCTGVGQTFEGALDQYFSTSKLDSKGSVYNTDNDVQQEGDAFLWSKIIHSRDHEQWVEEIIKIVRKLFNLIPPEKHTALASAIKNSINDLDQFIKASENEKIVRYYDARLWRIVQSVYEHFDPLADDHQRKELREYVIADSCRKVMTEEDIIPSLDSYLQALQMHQEIIATEKTADPNSDSWTLIDEYKKNQLCPEVEEHRKKIREYHARCKAEPKEKVQSQQKK